MPRKKREFPGVEPITECYCPRCERTHNTFFNWQGRGVPRILCWRCKKIEQPDERTYTLNTKAMRPYLQDHYKEDRIHYR